MPVRPISSGIPDQLLKIGTVLCGNKTVFPLRANPVNCTSPAGAAWQWSPWQELIAANAVSYDFLITRLILGSYTVAGPCVSEIGVWDGADYVAIGRVKHYQNSSGSRHGYQDCELGVIPANSKVGVRVSSYTASMVLSHRAVVSPVGLASLSEAQILALLTGPTTGILPYQSLGVAVTGEVSWGISLAPTQIIAANAIASNFSIRNIVAAQPQTQANTTFELYSGPAGNEVSIGQYGDYMQPNAPATTSIALPVNTGVIAANSRISARCYCGSAAGQNVYMSLEYQTI